MDLHRESGEQSCIDHDDAHPSELAWVRELEPSQIDGLFWCFAGSHYARVTAADLPSAMSILERISDLVPV